MSPYSLEARLKALLKGCVSLKLLYLFKCILNSNLNRGKSSIKVLLCKREVTAALRMHKGGENTLYALIC
jgi:hypothetical protein